MRISVYPPRLLRKLYGTHLTESGFLLSYRPSYFEDPAIAWPDVAELEESIAAHVDGMELGGDLARQCALEFLATGDEDELRGAVYALATIALDEVGLNTVIDAFTKADDALIPIYIEALKHGKHPALVSKLQPLLEHERPLIRAASVEILGYRRQGDPKRAWRLLHDADPNVKNAAIVACARYGNKDSLAPIEQMAFAKAPLADAYVLPLLILGSTKVLEACRRDCGTTATTTAAELMALGLFGAVQDIPFLLANHTHTELADVAIQATGFHGYVAAIPSLLNALKSKNEDVRTASATALDFMTAANLREKIQIQETDEDLSTEDITGAPIADKPLDKPPPTLRTVERISTDFERWTSWWRQNQRAFPSGERFRHGKPFSVKGLTENMANPDTPASERQLTYIELIIHSGRHIGFESDWFIAKQWDSIKNWGVL